VLFYEAGFTYKCYCGGDAIRFVSEKSKDKEKSLANSNEHEKEESNEPDYDEEDQLEEEQEEQSREIRINLLTALSLNQTKLACRFGTLLSLCKQQICFGRVKRVNGI
jgi:uncharacterized membrane protein YdbT with pleckstrin-like domain